MAQLVTNETHGVNAEGAEPALSRANTPVGETLLHRTGQFPPGKVLLDSTSGNRSEERRVGKECRSRWSPYH